MNNVRQDNPNENGFSNVQLPKFEAKHEFLTDKFQKSSNRDPNDKSTDKRLGDPDFICFRIGE